MFMLSSQQGVGRHTGKNPDGSIDRQIPGAEYIEIPSQNRKTIIVHGGDGSQGYHFVIKGTGDGAFDFTAISPDRSQNSSDTITYQAVPVDATTAADVTLDQTRNYTLNIDTNGDGAVDSQVQPNSVATNSVDLSPPADTTDLAVTNVTSGTATLSFTAPGGDGNAGQAQYYDIRYSTSPITEDNWKDAMPIEQDPDPLLTPVHR